MTEELMDVTHSGQAQLMSSVFECEIPATASCVDPRLVSLFGKAVGLLVGGPMLEGEGHQEQMLRFYSLILFPEGRCNVTSCPLLLTPHLPRRGDCVPSN